MKNRCLSLVVALNLCWLSVAHGASIAQNASIAENASTAENALIAQDAENIAVFVSFAMPTSSLVAVLRDAQKIHASVLIQGLVENNFKTTFLRINAIVRQAGGGGVSIDPLAFAQYHITQVPSVVVGAPETCFDVIAGDIPLLAALKTLRDHGACHFSLTQKLAILEGDAHG